MTQKTSPFIEAKWGWNLGEDGWNSGADENWLKFSYMFDRNVDGIVSSLPPAVNGTAYFNTVDNRFYFVVDGTYYSSPCPKWFVFALRTTGEQYQFDGSSVSILPSNVSLDSRLDTVETTLSVVGYNLGPQSVAPTTRQNGGPLRLGDTYFNTTDDLEYLYKYSGWEANIDGQLLASPEGANYVGYQARSAGDIFGDMANVKNLGAIADGNYYPVSDWYTIPAVHYRGFADLAAVQLEYPHVESASDSIDWVATQAAVESGKVAYAPRGKYVLNKRIYIENYADNMKGLVGDGLDVWEQLFQSLPKKNGVGTHFMMYGTGDKIFTSPGVTDNAVSGGAFPNPEPVALDTLYSLTSFHENDASNGVPSTLRTFSCGIYIAPGSRNVVLKGFRIHPYFNGIDGYNNAATYLLGDDWDVGIYNDNSPDVWIEDVQSVGYWRIAGMYQACVTRTGVQGASYQCRYNRVNFQGRVGFLLRGGDTYRMLQRTANTVDIPWQSSHPFPASGEFNTNSGTFNYTSTSKVTDGTFGEVLRFNGVTGDTSGVTQVRIASGFGIGGTSIQNYLITGLEHTSGKKSSSFEIGLGVSSALEISGGFRQPFFSMGYVQSAEDVLAHLHNIGDLRFVEGQFESNGRRGRMIASPQDINNTRVPYANGSTSITLIGCHIAGADEMPLVSRSETLNTFTGAGFWQPQRIYNQDRQYPDSDQTDISAMLTQHVRINIAPGMQCLIRDSAGANLFSINEATGNAAFTKGQINLPTAAAGFINAGAGQNLNLRQSTTIRLQVASNGDIVPGALNSQKLGTDLLQWSDVRSVVGTFSGPVKPGQYTLATLPSASAFSGYEICVTDATGGPKLCRSNGSVWQIINTTTTVS